MASTFSELKFELIGTGDQSGSWGTTTNTNIGTAIQDAITGSADVTFASADVTVTLTDTVAAQTARNLRLNLTGTTGGARNLILGSGCQIEKLYLINNGTADTITVKNTTGTGIAVPAGKSMFVYNNATNVVDATTHLSSLTLGTALPITSGGTGSTSTTFVNLASNVTGTLPIANGGTGTTSTTFVNLASNVTGTLPIANGGTGTTSTTFVNLASNVTGTLPIANGGTGTTSTTFVNLASNVTGTLPIANGGTGTTSTTFVNLASNVTGQLPLSNGGTGANLTDPNADRILFWDDSATSVAFLEAGSGLSISGTTLSATASFNTPLTVVGNATAGAEIRLPEDTDNGSNYVAIKAPDNIASNATLTAPAVTDTLATIGTAQTFTAAQTFRAANAIRSEAADTQDAVIIAGRAGGTSSYAITLTPATLSASRTLTLPEPGEDVTLGYLNVPQNIQTGSYTLVLADAGKHIYRGSGSAATWTIPANGSVAYPIGTALTFINLSATSVSIAITTDTMYLSSAGTTGTRTLAQYGSATAVKITSTSWIISGSGLT